MKIINFAEQNSIINKYMAEMRDKDYQTNRLLFRNNIMRVGELIAYELSKTFDYEERDVQTPLGTARVNVPTDKLVLGTIFRAGLPFHQGFLNIFDHAGNAFVSAFREYEDEAHTKVGIHVEYLATPDLNNATLLIVDPMLATGGSMEMGYKALLTKGTPKKVHVVCVMASCIGSLEELYGEIEIKGLNAYFGFLHRDAEKHPTLASDMMEEWRAVLIDSTVMSMINGHEVYIDEFYSDDGEGVYISKQALNKFIKKLENKFQICQKYLDYIDYPVSFRSAISFQMSSLVDAIIHGDVSMYSPIMIR